MFCTLFDLSINIFMLFVRLRKSGKGRKQVGQEKELLRYLAAHAQHQARCDFVGLLISNKRRHYGKQRVVNGIQSLHEHTALVELFLIRTSTRIS